MPLSNPHHAFALPAPPTPLPRRALEGLGRLDASGSETSRLVW